MELNENQVGQTEEEISPKVPAVETKVSEPKTYTAEEYEKRDTEARRFQGDADRHIAMYSQTQQQLQQLQTEIESRERDQYRREREAAEGDPEKLSALDIRQQNRADRKALETQRAADKASTQKYEQDLQNWYQKAVKLHEESGAPISNLMAATTDVHMEDLAKFHKERMKDKEAVSTKEESMFESGVSSAPGKRVFNKESLDKMTTGELMAAEKELDEAMKSGKIR